MPDKHFELLSFLADGHFHSGEGIGNALGISRASVWKLIRQLEALDLEIHAVSGRGYKLSSPIELLSKASIKEQLSGKSYALLTRLEIHHQLDSSNSYLMQQAVNGAPGGFACFTEYQQSGRGRRGREWFSPYGRNIYLSLLWRFHNGASELGGLSLAVSVALMRALETLGLPNAGIKWPNDILVDEKKLAGILVEVGGESNGPCHAVIGIGLNYAMGESTAQDISQPWTDLRRCGIESSRNAVAGKLLHELLLMLRLYESGGLDAFRDEWQRWDLINGRPVTITQGDKTYYGVPRGIDEHGLLLMDEAEKGIRRYASGEVSLRTVKQ